jgi:hypothetical protein
MRKSALHRAHHVDLGGYPLEVLLRYEHRLEGNLLFRRAFEIGGKLDASRRSERADEKRKGARGTEYKMKGTPRQESF